MSRLRTQEERENSPSGKLECVACGMTFKLTDGESILIDHFSECEGNDG